MDISDAVDKELLETKSDSKRDISDAVDKELLETKSDSNRDISDAVDSIPDDSRDKTLLVGWLVGWLVG